MARCRKPVLGIKEEDDVGKKAMSVGQHGGAGGFHWDDGVFSSIKQVVITHARCVDSIQTEYDDNGSSIWSSRHGGNGGSKSEVVLEYSDEYLISIHGYVGNLGANYVIRSLNLESNKRIYGPFGEEDGTKFWFPTTGAKIVGLHGRSYWYLDSIGIKVIPIHKNKTAGLEG